MPAGLALPSGASVANHESPRTTKLSDRANNAIRQDETELGFICSGTTKKGSFS